MSRRHTEADLAEFQRRSGRVRQTAEKDAKVLATAPKRKTKYGNNRVEVDGEWFDSEFEAAYYNTLKIRAAAKQLWFIRQVTFRLTGGVKYVADFLIVHINSLVDGERVEVVDTTGMLTQVKINKLKQVKALYGVDVQVVRKDKR